ncbi:MAG: hypothetical protein RL213_1810 [Bacteroidota bacterium]|jgi:outer membrane lipoprotein-sorting protein
MQTVAKILICVLLLANIAHGSLAQDAREIVRQADQRMKGKTSYAKLTLRTERPTYFRELQLEAWTMGDSLSLIRILSPAKDRGTSFLRRDKEVWNWLPTIERTIKLPPSMMSQSWMGTDFTNDDLVKEASIVKDYEHRLMGSETVAGLDCYRIELTPHPEAAVVWGKIVLMIDKKDRMLLKALYFDEEGELVNTMTGGDIGVMGGMRIPCRLEMSPLKKPGNKTVMTYTELRFDIPMDPERFTPQKLQQGK